MRLIDRYLFRQLLGPTALAVAALTAVALLGQSLSTLDVIVDQRQSALVFLQITVLALPQLINMVLPVALFAAMLVALNRLHTEQEIVVCFAGGMSRGRVIAPALRLASLAVLGALVMNLWIQPMTFRAMREVLFEIRSDLAASLLREGEFTEPAAGVTVYAQTIENGGLIKNLFIHQEGEEGRSTTYMASEGRMASRGDSPVLLMKKGSIQEFSDRGVLNYLAFEEYNFDLKPLISTDELLHYKISDRYLHELFFPDLEQDWERKNRVKLLAEGHARLASPLYNLTFVALALWAIIGGSFSRLGYGRRIAIAGGAALGLRVVGFGVQAACEAEATLNLLQYVIPLAGFALALAPIFRGKARPAPFRVAALARPV
ncbi:MAG: LPS export ABC transporter permease LptF [Caulobacteraceae bacterium]|nr:LPS export ABC transporter permease LptF [Caulobacteraceae bacterium]